MESKWYSDYPWKTITLVFVGGRASGLASRQDCTQFEDALRRLYALELKLTDQVSHFWGVQYLFFDFDKGVLKHHLWSADSEKIMPRQQQMPKSVTQVIYFVFLF